MKLVLPLIIGTFLKESPKLALVPKMVDAEKFIFRSANELNTEVSQAVCETTEEMIDWDLLHLPSRLTWIEDPVRPEDLDAEIEENEFGRQLMIKYGLDARHCMLAEEFPDRIEVHVIKYCELPPGSPVPFGLEYYDFPSVIDLRKDRPAMKTIPLEGEFATFALRNFLATLATPQVRRERLEVSRHNLTKPINKRHYSHTIIRVDLTAVTPREAGESTGRKKAQEFVRGYTWGKHTRPRSEQRFIAPFFRGDPELGLYVKKHYEVPSPTREKP